jgi:hypothetical protein
MAAPQLRHLPLSQRQLNMGILSLAGILYWHSKQWDGGEIIDLPAGKRSATTLIKLPRAAPSKKNTASHKTVISNIIPHSDYYLMQLHHKIKGQKLKIKKTDKNAKFITEVFGH